MEMLHEQIVNTERRIALTDANGSGGATSQRPGTIEVDPCRRASTYPTLALPMRLLRGSTIR
jgi:hypothetical protein